MPDVAFANDEFQQIIRRFADEAPRLLLRHGVTADLALRIENLHLLAILQERFTVAIVGQMRVGKSTLLNALIGDDIAPTGVTETTATVNWFRHATAIQCDHFRVHWTNGDVEDVPLSEVSRWIGSEENARRTQSLDFFAETDFLRIANVVDTPGIRSVIGSHEDATQGFLAEKLEQDTLLYGGRADAVVYAINPVGRESDRDHLRLFGERTRLPGATAVNSIAVVQKWEHLRPDPLTEVVAKCERLRAQLEGKVSDIIPTSGLLARLVDTVPCDTWESLVHLASGSNAEAIERIIKSDRLFCRDVDGIALPPPQREAIKKAIPWNVLPFCIKIAGAPANDSGQKLQQAVGDASGIIRLKNVLRERFFARSQLIKASTVLAKAWEPCQAALLRLSQAQQDIEGLQSHGKSAAVALSRSQAPTETTAVIETYIKESVDRLDEDAGRLAQIASELDELKYTAERNFRALDSEQQALELLQDDALSEFTARDRRELRTLFGVDGWEPYVRLRLSPDTAVPLLMEAAEEALDRWNARQYASTGCTRTICRSAVERIEHMIEYLEAGGGR